MDLDEVAHYEPSHQDLRCLQLQLFSSLVGKELINRLIQQDKDIYGTGSDIKLKAYINHLLLELILK